jgi:putative transposase
MQQQKATFSPQQRPKPGRKRLHSPGVAHQTRERVRGHTPLHINFKLQLEKGSLRNKTVLKFLAKAIARARMKNLRVVHFSLQHNHVHLLVEAQNNVTLTRGMRALIISLVMRLNRYWRKGGQRLKQRYHLHVLKTRREIINAYRYVRDNFHKHSGVFNHQTAKSRDPYSSWGVDFFSHAVAGALDRPRNWRLKQLHYFTSLKSTG